ncbi:MAG: Fe2+-dependent dioxygenase [Bacteroidetes bacterium]|nr:MAG: Fe2+-dependent dioxygenase [Bacteroidota bacterium]
MQEQTSFPALYLHIPQLISADKLPAIDELISRSDFVDGKLTATAAAKEVKNNTQIDIRNQQTLPLIQQHIVDAMNRSPIFQAAIFPRHIFPPLVSRYRAGMSYGWHVDSPLMGAYPGMRGDIAMTIFLSEPDTYEGGELVVLSPTGEFSYKLAKGDAIVYPCTQVHCVKEVTKGMRQVAVTWIQSYIRDAGQRQTLFELYNVHKSISKDNPNSPEANQLLQTHSNLIRMWAEA